MYHLLVAGTLLATMETPTELSDFQIVSKYFNKMILFLNDDTTLPQINFIQYFQLKTYVSTVVTTYLISLFFHVALERPLQNIIYRFKKKNN